ncbi:MAG TPA: hypothetical protein VFF58_00700 [Candidatus Nitrosotalea sp.]|nr:hypothetical protein [Candidatus Nitrosotalea sp.]
MASIPLPALDLKPVQQPDMMGDVSKLMALKSMMGQQQIQQQEIQKNQLALQDQQTLRESQKDVDWTQPDAFDKWIGNAQQKGVSPQTLSSLALQRSQYQEQLAKTDTASLAAEKERNSQLQGHIDAVKGITDPAKRAAAAQTQGKQILEGGLAKTPQHQQIAQALAEGKYVPTDDELSLFENGLTDHNTQIDQRLKMAETAKNSTEALLNQNKVDVINSWKSNPQQVLAQVDSIVPPTGPNAALNARTKSQVQFSLSNGDVDGAKAAIKQAAEQVGAIEKDIAVASNPQIQAGKVAVATAEGQARANIEAQTARGSNAALAEVPPHLVAPASAAATKAGEDYAQSKSVSDRLQAMMDAAKKGNVVSYQLIPEEGALQVTTSQGVHRINMAEIQNYGGGSLWQKLEGHIGKALTGASIPDSVLGDMVEMQKIQQEGSQTKYNNALKTINENYGAKFQPVKMDDIKKATPGAGGAFSWDAMPEHK